MSGDDIETTGFLLRVRPGMAAEYKRRHDEIWPEMKAMLLRSGILHYEIYLDPATDMLFAHIIRRKSPDAIDRHSDPVMLRWRAWMAEVLVMDGDRAWRRDLEPMFHLSAGGAPIATGPASAGG